MGRAGRGHNVDAARHRLQEYPDVSEGRWRGAGAWIRPIMKPGPAPYRYQGRMGYIDAASMRPGRMGSTGNRPRWPARPGIAGRFSPGPLQTTTLTGGRCNAAPTVCQAFTEPSATARRMAPTRACRMASAIFPDVPPVDMHWAATAPVSTAAACRYRRRISAWG